MMIKSSVTISLVPSLAGGPWIFWDDPEISISKARTAGFDGVELYIPSADAVDSEKLHQLLTNNDIELSAVGTGAGRVLHQLDLTHPNIQIRQKARNFIKEIIDFGAEFGAPAIIGSMQGFQRDNIERDQTLKWLIEGLQILSEYALSMKVKLIIEPLNRYETNLINTLAAGTKIIKSVHNDNIRLLADLFHMNIEEDSIPATILDQGDYVGYVHWSDSNRRPVGMGHTDFHEIGQAFKDINYDGHVSAETFPYPDSDQAAAQTILTINKYLLSI